MDVVVILFSAPVSVVLTLKNSPTDNRYSTIIPLEYTANML